MYIQNEKMTKGAIQSTRFKKGLIITDESWDLLSSARSKLEPQARDFLMNGLKVAKNKPICIVTVTPSDYAKGEGK